MHSGSMRGSKRWAIVFMLAVSTVAAACVDMSAPKGAASISVMQLPSLYIVLGDTMRDTNGVVMPPRVIAYDANGNELPDQTAKAQFFITDSLPPAHFANGVLVGDSLGIVHVIGQIGTVQTPAVAIPVTAAPESLTTTLTAATDTLRVPVGADSASSIGSLALPVLVRAADKTPVPGLIVTYALVSKASAGSLYLTAEGGALSTIDTTDGGGQASRTLTANSRLLTDSLAVVIVSAKYKGVPLKGAPDTLRIPIKPTFSLR